HSSAHFLPECEQLQVVWRFQAGFQGRSCNVASTCARSPSDRPPWISASESHPGYLLQSKRWLCLHSDSQTEAPQCFFPAQRATIGLDDGKTLLYRQRLLQARATPPSLSPSAFASGVSAQLT